MSGFAIKNLRDVEDQAVKFGLSPALEARFAREDLGCEQVALSYQRLAPGAKHPLTHRHEQDEELYVVLSGSGQVRLGDTIADVGAWDVIRVAPAIVRTFAAGPDGLEILAVGPARPGDAELLPSAWADEAGG